MEVFKEKKKEYEKEIQNIVASVTGGSNVDPIQIDVEDVTVEEMLEEVVKSTESMYALKTFLFDLILYFPSTIFQLYRDGSSWVEPVLS